MTFPGVVCWYPLWTRTITSKWLLPPKKRQEIEVVDSNVHEMALFSWSFGTNSTHTRLWCESISLQLFARPGWGGIWSGWDMEWVWTRQHTRWMSFIVCTHAHAVHLLISQYNQRMMFTWYLLVTPVPRAGSDAEIAGSNCTSDRHVPNPPAYGLWALQWLVCKVESIKNNDQNSKIYRFLKLMSHSPWLFSYYPVLNLVFRGQISSKNWQVFGREVVVDVFFNLRWASTAS